MKKALKRNLSGGRLLALSMALAGGLQGQAAMGYDGEGLIMVSDFGLPAIRIFDPAAGTIVFDLKVEEMTLNECNLDRVFCFPIGAEYSRVNGEDFINLALTIYDRRPQNPRDVKSKTLIQRIKIGPTPTVVWTLDKLDFSGLSDGLTYCDPSKRGGDTRCFPQLVHAIQVVKDDPSKKTVSVVMAEMNNHRISQATLNYTAGNTQGKVDWVLGEPNPEWPVSAYPNGVEVYPDLPGGPYLVATFYQDGGEQDFGGSVTAFRWVNGAWKRAWQHPQDKTSAPERLNTPHMGEILVDPQSGTPWVVYSHSRGTAGAWGTYSDYGGSFGVASFPNGDPSRQPTYLMDAVLMASDPALETHFSRDVDWLWDGSWLMSDAACESGTCTNPSRIFRVMPLTGLSGPSARGGHYMADESGINKVGVPDELILEEYQCGLKVLFESQWIRPDEMGTSLSELADSTTTLCPPWQ